VASEGRDPDPHDVDAGGVTAATGVDAATFEVAGLTCRIECAYAKPRLWVTELHPAFRSAADPDVVVTFQYDDGYWTRGLPWIASDRLLDAPVFDDRAGGALLRTSYYDAEIDDARTRVFVRVAGGFGVGGMLRALYAVLLPRRGACLVRASIQVVGDDTAVLVCDDDEDGVVALVARNGEVEIEPTPFHHGTTSTRERVRRVVGIDLPSGARRLDAAAQILSRVVTVDHSAATMERVLDLVTGLSTTIDVGVVGVRD
jgi:hypothetical protein